ARRGNICTAELTLGPSPLPTSNRYPGKGKLERGGEKGKGMGRGEDAATRSSQQPAGGARREGSRKTGGIKTQGGRKKEEDPERRQEAEKQMMMGVKKREGIERRRGSDGGGSESVANVKYRIEVPTLIWEQRNSRTSNSKASRERNGQQARHQHLLCVALLCWLGKAKSGDVTGPWTLDTDGGVDLGKPDSRTLVGMTDFPGYLMYPLWTDVLTSQSVSQALREPDQPTLPLLLPASSTTAQTDRPETE
ncbi:uncharacterized protein BO96DRAFT_335545, partial [Aspergillus niger CBS 101883]